MKLACANIDLLIAEQTLDGFMEKLLLELDTCL